MLPETQPFTAFDWQRSLPQIQQLAQLWQPSSLASATPIPAAPVTTPPPSPGTGHWSNPNYEQLISADPGYQAALASTGAGQDLAARQRTAAVRRALIEFGAAPASWSSGYGDVDQASIAAAQQNPDSIMKQLETQRMHGSADLLAALGARGMVSSGALTGGEQVVQRGYDSALHTATQTLLDALGGYEGGYANEVNRLQGQLGAARGEAGGRVQSLYPSQWLPDPTYQGPSGAPVQPTTYAGIGATPEPIVGPGAQTAITSDMVAPPDMSLLNPVQPPKYRPRAGYISNAYLRVPGG